MANGTSRSAGNKIEKNYQLNQSSSGSFETLILYYHLPQKAVAILFLLYFLVFFIAQLLIEGITSKILFTCMLLFIVTLLYLELSFLKSIHSIKFNDKGITLSFSDVSKPVHIDDIPAVFLHRKLCVLCLKLAPYRKRYIPIIAEQADSDTFRRIRVFLKCRY